MRRSWVRAIRRRGLLLIGAPILVTATLFVLLNHYFAEHMVSFAEVKDIERRISIIEQMKTLQPRLYEAHQLLKPQYQELEARSFKAPSYAASAVQMELIVRKVLQALYFDEIDIKPMIADPLEKYSEGLLLLEVSFVGVPQQLNRLESALAVNEYAIRVNKLNVVAENNLAAGSGNLRIKAQFLALHLQTPVDPSTAKKSASRQ